MQMHTRTDYSQSQYMQPQPGMMASHMYTASSSGSRDSHATRHGNPSGSAHMAVNDLFSSPSEVVPAVIGVEDI
ncbi:hypothetical protein H5410_009122 [Solanum commersonii]|uniref:Uncharacterized protein n=1 Tax=Solanum commersonii TaxID=4109 RepID=A0A9J6AH38_SOLCO|nr:hypothetical protein H5410_009122 [Solanum commersonii]